MNEMAKSEEHALFCESVRSRRRELGLTQLDVAERLGISQPAYSEIESGKVEPGLRQMFRVASALETSVHELLPVTVAARPKRR
jgi:transcriptional regulator with XRE-family HTH domain